MTGLTHVYVTEEWLEPTGSCELHGVEETSHSTTQQTVGGSAYFSQPSHEQMTRGSCPGRGRRGTAQC